MATAAVCLIRHEDGSFNYGVGIMYPDVEHLFFTKLITKDPVFLWRGMYAASKISCLSDDILEATVMVADEVVSLENSCFDNLDQCLSYDYTVRKLREEVLTAQPDENDIMKIVAGPGDWHIPVNDPYAKVVIQKKAEQSYGFFHQLTEPTLEPLAA